MTDEKLAQATEIVRKRKDPDLIYLYYDPQDPAFRTPSVPETVAVRKAAKPGLLPGALRIPPGSAVYYGVLPGRTVCEEKASGWVSASPVSSGFRTITAETLPAFRNRGIASACLGCLILNEEGPFLYLVRRQNLPSVHLAQRCGFRPVPGI